MSGVGELDLTFLGTGTSVGVPMIGCDCPVCQSADSRDKRDRCSLYVKSPEAAWVVDTGPEFRHQCLRQHISHLDAVLITHAHTDHVMGFDDLRRFTIAEEASLPVYATEATLAALKRIFGFAFEANPRWIGYFKPDPRAVTDTFMLGETLAHVLPVYHSRVETVGYMFSRGGQKRVAYISDVKQIPPATMDLVLGVDTLIVDCLRRRQMPTHFTVDEALAAVAEIQPRRAYFTHLGHELGHAELEAELPPHIRVAYDGLKITC